MAIRLVRNANLSTNHIDKSDIKIYPNPVQDILNIESQETVLSVEVFDLLGKKILVSKDKTIDVSKLKNGIYLLKINTENGVLTEKIMKKGGK
ncbi:MAG TPA: T9SS type A sorting domain-containing protein [Flavobacterium sp.]|nr:T9SS type A sorting domain-containing protein [Flavobacterium sp.]